MHYMTNKTRLFGPEAEAGHLNLLTTVDQKYIGPGVLACATRVGGRSEAGNCFYLLFSSFFLLFVRLLIFTHFVETPVREFFFLSFYAFCFSPTSGKLPPYFAMTKRNI